MSELRLFTSESVTEGHPDKVCDQISDTILDAILEKDPKARVAVETMATTGLVHVAGEVTCDAYVDIPTLIREKVLAIGYNSSEIGFDGRSCGVSVSIGEQSRDIAQGVDSGYEVRELASRDAFDAQGAGDQGIMFGFATTETPTLMPAAISLAHQLSYKLAQVRKSATLDFLRPDGKTQVTIGYEGNVAKSIDTVVLSTQHSPNIETSDLRAAVREAVIEPILEQSGLDYSDVKILINPTGRFESGGPMADAGLTGRKISAAKTLVRSTARPLTQCAGWQRTWLQPVWPTRSRCRLHMPSVKHALLVYTLKPLAPRSLIRAKFAMRFSKYSISDPQQ